MTNYNFPLNKMNIQPPPPPNFPHPPHGFGPPPQQYWNQFYNGQQQFSNHPSMQSMVHIPNMLQMTEGFPNQNYVNSNAMRPVNNIWSHPSHQFNKEGSGRSTRTMQGGQFHSNQPRWNNGCQNGNSRNQKKNKNQQKKMKEKIDKRDLAENNLFFCDACDRGFKTEQVYSEHVNNHQKCSYKGCSYVAASKLVELHCKLQHRNGYAKKIWSLESKEDIENWIKARKSNYPTAANTTKKKMLNNEKIERGEVLETKQFGKMKGKGRFDKRDRNSNWKRKNEDRQDLQVNKKMKSDYEEVAPSTDLKEAGDMKVDDPLSILIHSTMNSNNLTTDNNNDTSEKQSVGLTSILTCYGSDTNSSDTEDDVTTVPLDDQQAEEIPTNINDTCRNTIESDTVIIHKTDTVDEQEQNKNTGIMKRKRNRNKKHANFHNEPQKKKPTLLEMLLAKEIRHERNVILQCVHYIVKKNFLEVGKSC